MRSHAQATRRSTLTRATRYPLRSFARWYKDHPLTDNKAVAEMNAEIERMVEQSTNACDPETESECWVIDLRDKNFPSELL